MVVGPRTRYSRTVPDHDHRGRVLRQAVAVPLAVVFLLPLWFLLVGSLRHLGLPPPTSVQWWPTSPAWSRFVEVFDVVPIGGYTVNSLIVAAGTVPLSVAVSSSTGSRSETPTPTEGVPCPDCVVV